MKTVLLVDDEDMIREMLKDFFESVQFKVFEARNGRDAFALIQRLQFDCVVSDVRMPGGDGIELAQNVAKMTANQPKFIFITGFIDASKAELQEIGVFRTVTKPFHLADLLNAVYEALGLATIQD